MISIELAVKFLVRNIARNTQSLPLTESLAMRVPGGDQRGGCGLGVLFTLAILFIVAAVA